MNLLREKIQIKWHRKYTEKIDRNFRLPKSRPQLLFYPPAERFFAFTADSITIIFKFRLLIQFF